MSKFILSVHVTRANHHRHFGMATRIPYGGAPQPELHHSVSLNCDSADYYFFWLACCELSTLIHTFFTLCGDAVAATVMHGYFEP